MDLVQYKRFHTVNSVLGPKSVISMHFISRETQNPSTLTPSVKGQDQIQ